MGAFDQAARYAARAAPEALLGRLVTFRFREWMDTRKLPFPGHPDRTADLIAALDDPAVPSAPWLLVFEFQAQPDPDKLDATLELAGNLRAHVFHGEDQRGRYKILTALVYLKGECPDDLLDMTIPGGFGTRHAPLVWNIEAALAARTLDEVADGSVSWGMLFWIPLMAGGDEDGLIRRWRDIVTERVTDHTIRANLVGVALVFAELAGRFLAWERGLEGWEMTESQVVNRWIGQGEAKGKLLMARQDLLEALELRFPGAVPTEVTKLVDQQTDLELLRTWFRAALRVYSFDHFMDVLKG